MNYDNPVKYVSRDGQSLRRELKGNGLPKVMTAGALYLSKEWVVLISQNEGFMFRSCTLHKRRATETLPCGSIEFAFITREER